MLILKWEVTPLPHFLTIEGNQMNYAKTLQNTPQTMPLPGQNMVKNNAGGYGYQITAQQQLERFLLIGSEGGTYYVGEQKLTEDNAKVIIDLIKANDLSSLNVLRTVETFITQKRAPKIDASLFVLALLCTYAQPETKKEVYKALPTLLTTGTNLFMFVAQVNELRGWSAGLRKAIARWYTNKEDGKLAYQLVKYRNREGFTHKDVLRLAHPKSTTISQNLLFKYAVDKYIFSSDPINKTDHLDELLPKMILAFEAAKTKDITVGSLVRLIKEFNLTWEMIPTDYLNTPQVLTALLEKMPTVAMIRNLNRFAKAGMTKGMSETTKTIINKLNKEAIEKSGIHPVNLINSLRTYSTGRGDKGDSTWDVNSSIVSALNDAYEFALKNVTPTGKTILIGLDVSGSMNNPVTKTSMTASQLGCVLAVTLAKTEKFSEVIGFDTQLQKIPVGKHTTIESACKAHVNGGGTDCSVPFAYALDTKAKYDAIVILTDSESWAGSRHGTVLLDTYRKKFNKDVKVIEIAMTATPHSQLPTNDSNILRVVGFDSTVVQIINEFLK